MKNYDKNTDRLILASLSFDAELKNDFSLPEIIYLARESFKDMDFKKQFFGNFNFDKSEPFAKGFCLHASYLIMQNTIQKDYWEIRRLNSDNHWFLMEKSSGLVLDLTYDQFAKRPDYSKSFIYTDYKTDMDMKKIMAFKSGLLAKHIGLTL